MMAWSGLSETSKRRKLSGAPILEHGFRVSVCCDFLGASLARRILQALTPARVIAFRRFACSLPPRFHSGPHKWLRFGVISGRVSGLILRRQRRPHFAVVFGGNLSLHQQSIQLVEPVDECRFRQIGLTWNEESGRGQGSGGPPHSLAWRLNGVAPRNYLTVLSGSGPGQESPWA